MGKVDILQQTEHPTLKSEIQMGGLLCKAK